MVKPDEGGSLFHFRTDGSVDSDAVLGLLTRSALHFVHLRPVHLDVFHVRATPGDVGFLPDAEITSGAEIVLSLALSLPLPLWQESPGQSMAQSFTICCAH